MRLVSLYLVGYLFLACTSSNTTIDSGHVLLRHTFLDTAGTFLYGDTLKIWYKGNLAIEEIARINFHEDAAGKRFRTTTIMHYTFIDPTSGMYYLYKNFSDTASIFKTGPIDSLESNGGWNFHGDIPVHFKSDPEFVADTTINNIIFKRVTFKHEIHKRDYITTAYLRCDKKETMFNFYKSFSEKMDCPVIKTYTRVVNEIPQPLYSEIDFIADTLTQYQLKVFDTWERNARNKR